MKNLKFRAWDNIKKEWLLGYKECGGFSIMGECMMMGGWEYVLSRMVRGEFGEEGEKLIVQQYTGLQDKNGVDIYEGDIVNIIKENKCYPVNFGDCFATADDNYCGTECFGYYIDGEILGSTQRNWGKGALISENMEVVGNILEHLNY